MINSYQLRTQISFLVFLVIIIVPNYATSKSLVELYNAEKYKKIIDAIETGHSDLPADQRDYLLLKVYEKLSDLQSQKKQLLQIESNYPEEYRDVVLIEKLNFSIGSKSSIDFFYSIADVFKKSESSMVKELASSHLINKASQVKDKQILRPALEAYISHIEPDEDNKALVTLYSEVFNSESSND